MTDPRRLAVIAVLAAVVLAPIGVDQPGMPMAPRGDEATYRLMIASLLATGDLRYDAADSLSLYEAFPFVEGPEARLASRLELVVSPEAPEGVTETVVRYARPALYPLIAAPFVALFGGAGPMVLGGLLLALMIVLGLRRLGYGDGALLTVGAFTLLSPLLPYAYLTHPELLAAALVWLGLETAGCCRNWRFGPAVRLLSGASIALAAWLEPLAGVALVPAAWWALWGERADGGADRRSLQPIQLVALVVGAVLGLALALSADRMTGTLGHATASDDLTVYTATIENPLEPPIKGVEGRPVAAASPWRAAFYLIAGRHAGLLSYFPFAVLALLAAAMAFAKQSPRRRDVGLVIVALGIASVWAIWRLSGLEATAAAELFGAPANRWLLVVYPLFFFLLGRRPSPALAFVGGSLSVIVLGGFLTSPFGMPVAESSIHSHVRGWPLRLMPLELEWLDQMPDYRRFETVAGWLFMRRDEVEIQGDQVRALGGIRTDLWLEADRTVGDAHLLVQQLAPRNRVELALGKGDGQTMAFADVPAEGVQERLRLVAGPANHTADATGGQRFFYRLSVETDNGARLGWRAGDIGHQYIGAGFTYLGDDDFLSQEIYSVQWLGCGVPRMVGAGDEVAIMARLQNTSGVWWPVLGPARVRLGARWRDQSGREVPMPPWRADFGSHIRPGETVSRWIRVEAPRQAGLYQLDIEPLFENVAWFSDRGVPPCTNQVEVAPGSLRRD